MDITQVVQELAEGLEKGIKPLPESFYDTFDYTKTGCNLTHPVTLGIISVILRGMLHVEHVAVDWRVNLGNRVKIQPDLTAMDASLNPILFIDYESPNSSDFRVIKKDIMPYLNWQEKTNQLTPYIIITTLPNKLTPKWKLLWTSAKSKQYNQAVKGFRDEVRKNPFEFWYRQYRTLVTEKSLNLKRVFMLNIEGKRVVIPCLGSKV